MSFLVFCVLASLVLITFYSNSKKISIKTNLYKKYNDNTPLTGGVGIFLFFISGISYLYYVEDTIVPKSIYIILFASVIFLIGVLDDIYNISYKFRLFSIFTLIFVFINLDNRFLINQLYFETFNQTILLNFSSYFLTSLFILLFMNSINMADGINGNSALIFLVYIFLFYNKTVELNYFLILICVSLLIFLFFNLNNKLYMGDSGIYFLSFLISIYVIYNYKFSSLNLSCEKIFLVFMIPGIDMFRLFCLRIYCKKNPFKGDMNHFHHILFRKLKLKYALIVYISLILWPNLLDSILDINKLILILMNVVLFFTIIFFFKKTE
tara:strand:- start:1808 stop:2779 length:972 start_codon:yes stop_codon:yes gene_type:complete